jgi:hypothetical protein
LACKSKIIQNIWQIPPRHSPGGESEIPPSCYCANRRNPMNLQRMAKSASERQQRRGERAAGIAAPPTQSAPDAQDRRSAVSQPRASPHESQPPSRIRIQGPRHTSLGQRPRRRRQTSGFEDQRSALSKPSASPREKAESKIRGLKARHSPPNRHRSPIPPHRYSPKGPSENGQNTAILSRQLTR